MKSVLRMILLSAFLSLIAGCSGKGTVFYVSLSGNDSWIGKLAEVNSDRTDGPFATLEKARDAIRALKQAGPLPKRGVTVYIREGAYSLSTTFKLTAKDSGIETAPIVWKAFNGENVQLIGGKEITGFQPIDDPSVLKRINGNIHNKILKADLKAQGITDYGTISDSGPGIEFFFQDKRMTLARYPNEGWLKIKDVPQSGKLKFKGVLPHMRFGIPVGKHYGRFTYEGDRPKRWTDVSDVYLHGYWSWDWRDAYINVKAIDTERREIYPQEPYHGYGYTKNQRYYALNIFEELDMPGEWYLDRTDGILYFFPPSPIENGRTFVSILTDPLISLENTEYIRVQGVNLEFSRGSAVTLSGGSHNLIAGCTIRNLGTTAVAISGGKANGITGCDIYDIASGGITLSGGDRKTLTPGNNFASNNHIHHYSTWRRTYCPAISISGVENRLDHNLIHDAPHSGIILSGNEHIIEYNELHSLAQQTGDVGAFYMGRDWTQRGIIIRHNYFHDLLGPGLHGVMAVYLDDWTSGITIYGNLFYKAGRAAFIGGGRDNTVENNIFIECAPSTHIDARGLGWAKYYFDKTMDIYVNTLFDRMDAMNYSKPPYSEKYPELLKLYEDEPAIPKNNRIIRNVSYGGRWIDLYNDLDLSIVTVKDNLIALPEDKFEADDNMVIDVDPGFVDRENENFQLKDDSPAYKLGFKRIPIEKMGLYVDEYRKSLPEK